MSETEVVVFPSPAFVGVIAVTQISFPSAVSRRRSRTREVDLRLGAAVRLDLLRLEPGRRGDLLDRPERRGLRDLEAGGHLRLHRAGA